MDRIEPPHLRQSIASETTRGNQKWPYAYSTILTKIYVYFGRDRLHSKTMVMGWIMPNYNKLRPLYILYLCCRRLCLLERVHPLSKIAFRCFDLNLRRISSIEDIVSIPIFASWPNNLQRCSSSWKNRLESVALSIIHYSIAINGIRTDGKASNRFSFSYLITFRNCSSIWMNKQHVRHHNIPCILMLPRLNEQKPTYIPMSSKICCTN